MKKLLWALALGFLAPAHFVYAVDSRTDSLSKQKAYFKESQKELEAMIWGKKPLSYERAIFLLENAWWEGAVDWDGFQQNITNNIRLIKALSETGNREQDYSDLKAFELAQMSIPKRKRFYEKALSNWAIFRYITDTTYYTAGNNIFYHEPFGYSFADPLSTNNWRNTHVTNLLLKGEGNCFALASLYKIFSERLQSNAWLSVAPGHIFIRHDDDKGIPYNLELSSGVFPGSGTIETFTHTSREAVMNNIAMRDLDLKQSVALCLVYLAKGYEFKFGTKASGDFALSCAESALSADSLSLAAMLLKADVLEQEVLELRLPVSKLQKETSFVAYQKWVQHIFMLGHREMPLQMKNLLIKGWTKDSFATLPAIDYRLNSGYKGVPDTRYASLSWGVFDEEIYTKPVEQYGRTLFDTKTKKIVGFADEEATYNHYNFDPVAFAWNVDPLAHKFPWQSPYSAFDNNPINKTDPDGRAGEPVVKDGQLTIYSHILFYGSAANPKLAEIASNNISSQWSTADGTVSFKGTAYSNVHFVTTYEVVEERVAQSRATLNKGETFDPRLNFARIERRSEVGSISNMMSGKAVGGDNSFYLLAEDIKPGNTSQAHEWGHGFGMGKHIGSFEKWGGIPRIMTTIQTAVEGKYTVDGKDGVPQGDRVLPLHQLNPDNRQVTQDDLSGIKFKEYKNGLGRNQAGNSTNSLFNKAGDPQ